MDHELAGEHRHDVLHHGQRRLDGPICEERLDGARFDLFGNKPAAKEGADLRGEGEQALPPAHVERLDPEPIHRQEEPAGLAVPDGKGEHPAEPLDARGSVLGIGLQNDFRVGSAAKDVP
jgi:hypothetical protein